MIALPDLPVTCSYGNILRYVSNRGGFSKWHFDVKCVTSTQSTAIMSAIRTTRPAGCGDPTFSTFGSGLTARLSECMCVRVAYGLARSIELFRFGSNESLSATMLPVVCRRPAMALLCWGFLDNVGRAPIRCSRPLALHWRPHPWAWSCSEPRSGIGSGQTFGPSSLAATSAQGWRFLRYPRNPRGLSQVDKTLTLGPSGRCMDLLSRPAGWVGHFFAWVWSPAPSRAFNHDSRTFWENR